MLYYVLNRIIMKRLYQTGMFLFFLLCTPVVLSFASQEQVDAVTDGDHHEENKEFTIPFFDGVKIQSTNAYPKLTNANHMIHDINKLTGSSLRDWDTLHIFTLDIVFWKDLSKYFKTDLAISGATGSLLSSSNGFRGTPLDLSIRMRQRYTTLELWSNLYFYPFMTDYQEAYRSGHIIEPFIAVGFGYTFFRSESVFKFRKSNLFYNRIRNNWNDGYWGYKMMSGFNVNLGNVRARWERWLITFSAFQIWNRLKGHSSMHLTDGMKIIGRPVNTDIRQKNRMDIDLTGYHFSLAIGRYF